MDTKRQAKKGGHRSEVAQLARGRARRFEDSRNKRQANAKRRDMERRINGE